MTNLHNKSNLFKTTWAIKRFTYYLLYLICYYNYLAFRRKCYLKWGNQDALFIKRSIKVLISFKLFLFIIEKFGGTHFSQEHFFWQMRIFQTPRLLENASADQIVCEGIKNPKIKFFHTVNKDWFEFSPTYTFFKQWL